MNYYSFNKEIEVDELDRNCRSHFVLLIHGAVMRTGIVSRSYLSYEQTMYYIADLVAAELMEPIEDAHGHFRTTLKGHEFLEAHKRIQEMTPLNRKTRNECNVVTINF